MIGAALAIGQGLYGLYNSIKSGQEADDNQKRLEKMAGNSPLKKESPEINNYYQEALNRYQENPYQSAFYKQAQQNSQRAFASGISALNDRRSAGNFNKLYGMQNNALQNAMVQAENYKAQQFRNLGQASQAKAAEESQMFDINQATPYNRQFGLQQMKSQASNDRFNAGLNMLAQGVSNATQYGIAKEMYNPDLPKTKSLTTSNTENTNTFGSPFGKYGNSDFSKYGISNKGGFNSSFGKNYQLPKFGGLPKVNNYPIVDNYFAPNY